MNYFGEFEVLVGFWSVQVNASNLHTSNQRILIAHGPCLDPRNVLKNFLFNVIKTKIKYFFTIFVLSVQYL